MNRSLIRTRMTALLRPSRRMYAPAQEAWLQQQRHRIEMLELEGALFFGSAERLIQQAHDLPPDVHTLVLDFRRVSSIDASGSVALNQLGRQLQARGISLRLAGVVPGSGHAQSLLALSGVELEDATSWHPDTDHAVEAAECALLASAALPVPKPRCELADSALCLGLDATQCALLASVITVQQLPAQALLFSIGDEAHTLYVLRCGSITLWADVTQTRAAAPGQRQQQRQRYLSVSPGTLFGETAMLDGKGRSAYAQADVDSEVYALNLSAMQQLQAQAPALATQLMHNIALHLAQRLRAAGTAWNDSAR